MSYYPTIAEDLARARTIIANGLSGGDTYAATMLLQSLTEEVERLQRQCETYQRLHQLTVTHHREIARLSNAQLRRILGLDDA